VNMANTVWVSDITYIDTSEGWLYLATFIDLYAYAHEKSHLRASKKAACHAAIFG
jgi:transposase InsO family protein